MFDIRAGTHKMLARKANREDSNQTASSEAVRSGLPCLSRLLWQSLFSFCSQIKYFDIRAGAHKMLVRKANREDSDQTAWVSPVCLGICGRQLVFKIPKSFTVDHGFSRVWLIV